MNRAKRLPYLAGACICVCMLWAYCVATAASAPPARTASVKSAPECGPHTLVRTKSGPICGLYRSGERVYLDIPYAAPPVGKLRWASPQPVKSWTSVYAATKPAPWCPQRGRLKTVLADTSEDCLYLEVQEPASAHAGSNLPVMVEIHGGGFLTTFQSDNGRNFVQRGVVYVYPAYRLGILGFLVDSAFGPHSGDYGLQDQQAALKWVHDNIAKFGGNADNVTIFGESAGGSSVCDQAVSPTAAGLFKRGISSSGFYNAYKYTVWGPQDCKVHLQTEAQAQKDGKAFAEAVGCGRDSNVAKCLRALPLDTLFKNSGHQLAPFAGGTIGPIVNGTTLTMSPGEAFKRGEVNNVDLVIGVSSDEIYGGPYINVPGYATIATSVRQYRVLVKKQFGALAPQILAMYPVGQFPKPSALIAYRKVIADSSSVCPLLVKSSELAQDTHVKMYAYLYADSDSPRIPPVEHASPYPKGAYHSAISDLVHYNTVLLDANQQSLQNQIVSEWTGFARGGDPSVRPGPVWSRYTTRNSMVMVFVPAGNSRLVSAADVSRDHHCGFWNGVNRDARWNQ